MGSAFSALGAARGDAALERRSDRAGYVVLDGEDFVGLAVIALRPDVAFGVCVDQLYGEAKLRTDLSYAALDDELYAELATHGVVSIDAPRNWKAEFRAITRSDR